MQGMCIRCCARKEERAGGSADEEEADAHIPLSCVLTTRARASAQLCHAPRL
jgi:hypothetical protein